MVNSKKSEYRRNYREKIKNRLHAIKASIGCQSCGEKDPICLDFNHLGNKVDNISNMSRRFSWRSIIDEIARCQVICANCHRKHHLDCFRQKVGEDDFLSPHQLR